MQFFGFDGISLAAAVAVFYITSVAALYVTLWLIKGGKIPLWLLLLLGVIGGPLVGVCVLAFVVAKTWALLKKVRTLLIIEVGRD